MYISYLGTIPPVRWLAQEIIEEKKATTKSDVWSFGILLMEVFGRCKKPYGGKI